MFSKRLRHLRSPLSIHSSSDSRPFPVEHDISIKCEASSLHVIVCLTSSSLFLQSRTPSPPPLRVQRVSFSCLLLPFDSLDAHEQRGFTSHLQSEGASLIGFRLFLHHLQDANIPRLSAMLRLSESVSCSYPCSVSLWTAHFVLSGQRWVCFSFHRFICSTALSLY